MSSAEVRSVAVALENQAAGFGNTADGIPTDSGLTYVGLECDRASVEPGGEQMVNERNEARASAYSLPPEPVTMWSGGARVQNLTGTLTLVCPWRTIGGASTYANYHAMPIHMLLNSGMGSSTPSAASDTVASNVSTTRFNPTALYSAYTVGQGLAVTVAGRREFTFVTDAVDAGTDVIYHSPAVSTALTAGLGAGAIRRCQTLYSMLGLPVNGSGSSLTSVAIAFFGIDWSQYFWGCRWEKVALRLDNRRASLEFTMRYAHSRTVNGGGILAVNPTRAEGSVPHMLGSYFVVSGAIGTTSPAELTSARLNIESELEFSISNTLVPRGSPSTILGCADYEVTDYVAECSALVSVPSTTYDTMLTDQGERSVLVGFHGEGSGNGACVYIPAAHVTNDPDIRDVSGGIVRQRLNFRSGLWTLDTGSTAPADTNVRLAMAL